jgi:hypothetical protein
LKCSTVVWVIVRLCAILASLLGCSSRSADKPRLIRWSGKETNFQSTTAVPPADKAGSADTK